MMVMVLEKGVPPNPWCGRWLLRQAAIYVGEEGGRREERSAGSPFVSPLPLALVALPNHRRGIEADHRGRTIRTEEPLFLENAISKYHFTPHSSRLHSTSFTVQHASNLLLPPSPDIVLSMPIERGDPISSCSS
jgi:hypothetical protein